MFTYFNPEAVWTTLVKLTGALPLTLVVAAASLLAGLLLALPLAAARMKRRTLRSLVATVYVSFVRGTPPVIQLFLIFYGLPELVKIFGVNITSWNKVIFAALTFAVFASAFLSEVYRASYQAVDQGQMEAALSVGMTKFQVVRRIMLPQALIIAIPNLGNQIIGMIKETSLMFTIGLADLMGVATRIVSNSYGLINMEAFLAVGFVYWVLCVIIGQALKQIEKTVGKWRGAGIGKPGISRFSHRVAPPGDTRRASDGL